MEAGFDALQLVTENTESVRNALAKGRIEYVQLPQLSRYMPVIVISERDVSRALDALTPLLRHAGWELEIRGRSDLPLTPAAARTWPAEVRKLKLLRNVTSPNGTTLSSQFEAVTLEPWKVVKDNVKRPDGETFTPGTLRRKIRKRSTTIEYITPNQWRKGIDNSGSQIKWSSPHIFAVNDPIDVVYTWVDGSDPKWTDEKAQASEGLESAKLNRTSVSPSRFKSRDELRYSLRSLEYYASWVNHVYIVTDGQTPEWLNLRHPKVSIVDHREIFSDETALPVFNSHAIESQLHHIPGLTEKYLYLNDDVFFMRPVEPSLFFTSNGLAKFFLSKAPIDLDEPSPDDLPVLSAAKQNRRFLEENFGTVITHRFKHTPHSQLKSVLESFEGQYPDIFSRLMNSKFRSPSDLSVASSLIHYFAYLQGRAIEGNIKYSFADAADPDLSLKLSRRRRDRTLDVFCLNDLDSEEDRNADAVIDDFLLSCFPVPSSFEKLEEPLSQHGSAANLKREE
ncbi:hypothetical protein F7P83_07365 [Brevibacterium luteolum]|nr:hypothetical protein [Brevibacterium luteolum]